MVKKRKDDTLLYIWRFIVFLAKIPYFIVKGIIFLFKRSKKVAMKRKVTKKRNRFVPVFQDFKVLESEKGDFKDWEKDIFSSDSKIGVILGARGSGKTGFGVKFLENAKSKTNKSCFALGFKEEEMPGWIDVVSDISDVGNDSFVLVDEGGILFSSRKAMSSANKLLSDLILVARHKSLNILFISQNSSNLDVNILRQADFLVLKPSSLLQRNFERMIVQKIYESVSEGFEKFRDDRGLAYIYGDSFQGFISNSLPSFWSRNISKSFR